ncbi:hypothetical protein F5J12DRAFT_897376 [Pisolithus orientalis]|uniref:uncharacterized protein n=1 Tax=Pisolithus orientalis TaxID=936130 RepID=UPI002224FB18|nr:uncharacterized protein F5J12DRAFT_897376 [Pisolithus orientalis]KAI5992005.1 hypothetical protein F5J12DRAFT_897376 [Pisolithus orientalis]
MSVPVQHPVYYFQHGMHVFHVKNTLYRLHGNILSSHSLTFKEMFEHAGTSLSSDEKSDDESDGKVKQQALFDLFLDHIYGHSCHVGTAEAYSHQEIFAYHLSEFVRLGCDFHILKVFTCGFKELLHFLLKEISKEHRQLIGEKVFVVVVYMKAMLDEHHKIIACEEPTILSHAEVEAGLIFHKKDREGLVPKEMLLGEILEGEMTEIIEEPSVWREFQRIFSFSHSLCP